MLIALKEELKRLAADPKDPFHHKIRARVGKRATGMLEKRLKQTVLIMPSLITRIRIYWERKDSSASIKKLGGFLFAYLYNPQDFLSEEEHGLFGYLDDAYLVICIYEKVLEGNLGIDGEDIEFLKVITKTKKYVESLIPAETKKIKEMVDEAIADNSFNQFAEAFSKMV